jgi:hypothetical protein
MFKAVLKVGLTLALEKSLLRSLNCQSLFINVREGVGKRAQGLKTQGFRIGNPCVQTHDLSSTGLGTFSKLLNLPKPSSRTIVFEQIVKHFIQPQTCNSNHSILPQIHCFSILCYSRPQAPGLGSPVIQSVRASISLICAFPASPAAFVRNEALGTPSNCLQALHAPFRSWVVSGQSPSSPHCLPLCTAPCSTAHTAPTSTFEHPDSDL